MAEQTTGGDQQTAAPVADQQTDTQQQEQQAQPTYTQSDMDKAIAKALATREQNLKADFEKAKLAEQQKFKELYEKSEAEKARLQLERETAKVVTEAGLPALAEHLSADLSTVDARKALAGSIKSLIDAEVQRQVAEKLKTPPAPKGAAPAGTMTADDISKLSLEDYQKFRREGKIK